MSIYRYGKKQGFLIKIKETGRERYEIDEKKFYDWLNDTKLSDEYIYLKDACKEYKISYSELKYLLLKNKCDINKQRVVSGYMYAKRTDIERIINQYNRRSEKEK